MFLLNKRVFLILKSTSQFDDLSTCVVLDVLNTILHILLKWKVSRPNQNGDISGVRLDLKMEPMWDLTMRWLISYFTSKYNICINFRIRQQLHIVTSEGHSEIVNMFLQFDTNPDIVQKVVFFRLILQFFLSDLMILL